MYNIVSKLLIYGDMDEESILMQLSNIFRCMDEGSQTKDVLRTRVFKQVKRILEVATDYAFDKNLWHNYLTYLLITNENPFSITCEKVGASEGSVNHFAKSDFKAFKELFDFDFSRIEDELGVDCFSRISDYQAIGKPELMYNKNVSEKVQALSERLETAKDENEFFDMVTDFYKAYGVGMFGLNKAFRIEECGDNNIRFRAINNMDKVVLSDLVGYEIQKQKHVENTEAFIPIGTAYINAAIRRAGFNVDAINLNYRTKEELMEKIKFCDVILCGGTAHDWLKLRELFRLARNINPSVITVGGGAGYSSSPLVFSEITEVDYAVIGEGERTTCNVLSAIATGASIEEVKGVVYKYSDKYIYTGAAPIIGDFDSIPFPSYEGLDIDEYFAHQQGMRKRKMGEKNYFQFQYEYSDEPKELPMMLSRSCPFLCTFCFHTLGNKY